MAGRNFISRVLQYVANELIVDRLANSPTFQRFAVRSAKAIEDASQKSTQKTAQIKEQVTDFFKGLKTEFSDTLKNNKKR